MALDDLEKRLYGPEGTGEIKKQISPEQPQTPGAPAPSKWQDGAEEGGLERFSRETGEYARKFNVKKIFFRTLIVLGAALLVIGGYLLFQLFASRGVDLEAKYPDHVLVGVPFDFSVNYSNNSSGILKDAKLSITLPAEFSFVGEDTSKRVVTKNVGDVGTGTVGEEAFKIIALSGNQSSKRIDMDFEYNSSAIGSRFGKSAGADVFIGDSAANLDLQIPDKVLSGQLFEIHVSYKNISEIDLNNLELKLDYPGNFNFKTSSINPDSGNNIWELGSLRRGSFNELVIQGSMVAPANSFFEIKAHLASTINGVKNDIDQKSKTVSVSSAPLGVTIALNDRTDYISKANDGLNYVLNYSNNTDTGFRDVVIRVKLTGEMYDYGSLQTNGSFDSTSNTITWTASAVPELRVLDPGRSGKVEFRIFTLRNYPIKRFNDKNFTLKVEAEIESPTVPSFVAADRTFGVDKMETKVGGAITVDAKVLFRDASSGILNKGSVPPKVNQPTQYTVHWILANGPTDLSNIEIKASLRSGVKATGVIKSNIDAKPEYNDRTQEIIWKIPTLQADKGILGTAAEAIFQIEALPAVNQAGSVMLLMSETSLSSTDSFTGQTIAATAKELTTESRDDPTLGLGGGKVVQ